jgi:hypothetical protein
VTVAGTVRPRAGLLWWRIGRALALSAPQSAWPRLSQPDGRGPLFAPRGTIPPRTSASSELFFVMRAPHEQRLRFPAEHPVGKG